MTYLLITMKTTLSQTILTLKINNQSAQIGWLEILSIVVIAILVLGPKEFQFFKKSWIIHRKNKNTLSISKRGFFSD